MANLRVILALHVAVHILLADVTRAQNQTPAATDPSEVDDGYVNVVWSTWGLASQTPTWNISGEPCSGAAIDPSVSFDDYNPFIICDCSFSNSTTCHITQLRVYALSVAGPIPDELWNLTYLFNLNLAQNLLSGSLSPSIGNLTRMQSLRINALSGELPPQLGQLTELLSLSFSTNNFNGSLPSELGNLSKLQQLFLQGNSFNGSISSTFSNFTALQDLRISDVSNVSSSLEFIRNMTNLSILILRNNNISDSLPSDISGYQSLSQLDLLTGQIPNSLFNLSSLTYLFLGNNSLNGTLPEQKSAYLHNVDVSYNNLIGSFPSWVSKGLRLYSFTIFNSHNSCLGNQQFCETHVLPSGLNCLQRNFPCNRRTGIYSNFAVKCGGPQITSSSNIVYEMDNNTLGPATYYVTDRERWAVNNVDSELFQTTWVSASSLQYYGLGLEDGNYNVTLQFAEIQSKILNGNGNLVANDFDIRKEAGGASLTAVQKVYQAQISANYLEIHLFWAGKGTCCVPNQATYGPLVPVISAIPGTMIKTCLLHNTVSNNPPTSNKDHTGLIVGVATGVVVVILVFYFFLAIDTRLYTFNYAELKVPTDDFNPYNKLGEGGFGPVFKGTLNDGRVIAVKQLSVSSHQGENQFVAEIATISVTTRTPGTCTSLNVQHRNLVKPYGCCIDAENRLLVYEYLENKSLDQAIFGQRSSNLNWATCSDICLSIARGLTYLHEESRWRIMHRDVKASNILLDSDLILKYQTLKKADVFAFGVVALEVVSGRPNSDPSLEEEKIYLLEWIFSEFNETEAKCMVAMALLCTKTSPALRPPMSRVVAMLSGDIEVPTVFNDTTSFVTESTHMNTDKSPYKPVSTASTVDGANLSPVLGFTPMLDEIVGEGR
ncbi:hypothetical protein ACJRO7_026239 [Eucalyptus globulus]|uniref:non-specific serine/threonine protein kinase n=1 Tax=Eucalyptus globulus TaxID=34317 RepID=A0ABD3KC44_EUCGL